MDPWLETGSTQIQLSQEVPVTMSDCNPSTYTRQPPAQELGDTPKALFKSDSGTGDKRLKKLCLCYVTQSQASPLASLSLPFVSRQMT